MSSTIRNVGEAHRINGEFLNHFLYENGKPTIKKGKEGVVKFHTYQELWDELESIRLSSWDSYNEIKEELGW